MALPAIFRPTIRVRAATSISTNINFGLLVQPRHFSDSLIHQTVERIHLSARDGNFDIFEQSLIREAFDTVFHFLLCSHAQPCDEDRKEQAFRMVCNYVFSNQQEMRRIAETELSFRVEQEQYVLVGDRSICCFKDAPAWRSSISKLCPGQHAIFSVSTSTSSNYTCMPMPLRDEQAHFPVGFLCIGWVRNEKNRR